MKRIHLFILVMVIALCFSATIVNASSLSIGAKVTSSEWDEVYTGGIEIPDPTFESLTFASKAKTNQKTIELGYNPFSWLKLNAGFGIGSISSDIDWVDTLIPYNMVSTGKLTFKDNSGKVITLGVGIEKELSGWILNLSAQKLIQKNNKLEGTFIVDSYGSEPVSGSAKINEVAGKVSIGRRMGKFVPYVGVGYAKVDTKYLWGWDELINQGTQECNFESDKNIGMFIGTDWNLDDAWSLNLEGRFIDKQAISLAVGCKF
ncbi:MAG: hypothetical protein ABIH79_01110 [archaeon]